MLKTHYIQLKRERDIHFLMNIRLLEISTTNTHPPCRCCCVGFFSGFCAVGGGGDGFGGVRSY